MVKSDGYEDNERLVEFYYRLREIEMVKVTKRRTVISENTFASIVDYLTVSSSPSS